MSLNLLLFCMLFSFGLLLTIFKNPKYGLFVYLLVFYAAPASRWWGKDFPSIRWSLIVSLITLVAMMIHKKSSIIKSHWLSYFPGKALIIYAAWMGLQFIWVRNTEIQTDGFVLLLKYIIFYYMVYKLLTNEKDIIQFIMAHILGGFYLGVLAKQSAGGGRFEGTGGPGISDANTFGMHMATALIMGSIFLLYKNRNIIIASIMSIPFLLNAIVLTQSRGVFLSILVAAFTLLRLKPKSAKKKFYMLGLLGIMLFGILANDTFWDRMNTISGSASSSSVEDDKGGAVASGQSRFYIVSKQWKMFKDHPLGAGHRGTNILSPKYMGYEEEGGELKRKSSHNTIMSFLVNQGIVGIIIYFSLIYWVVISIEKLRKSAAENEDPSKSILLSSIGGGFTVFFIAGLFSNYMKAEVGIWLLALLVILIDLDKKKINS